jgi:fructose-1,6-bisphosphatase/inositol monophosphatase family enzyme
MHTLQPPPAPPSSSPTSLQREASSAPAGPAAKENIQVVVRVRPLSRDERARGDQECVHAAEDGKTVRWVDETSGRGVRASAERSQGLVSMRSLTFDACLAGSGQADVFVRTRANQLLRDAIAGYAVTIFAYGQTGSGKTYTMSGELS